MDSSKNKKKVLIVGSGPSGLVSLKEMLEAGHEAICIEKTGVIGGVFSTIAESAYDGLYLTISNVFMAYSDFPCEESNIRYSKKEEYAQYLLNYAKHFDLNKKVQFETMVESAEQGADGKWTIKTCSQKEGSRTIEKIDSLIVATGSNQTPKKTPEEIAQKFKGKLLHSSLYQNAESFKDERVLIIGTGESASDIACEIASVAKEVAVWARRPFIVAPRFGPLVHTRPDYDEFRWLTDKNLSENNPVAHFLETITTSRSMNALSAFFYGMVRQFGWKFLENAKGVSPGTKYIARYSLACTSYKGVPRDIYYKADQAAWVTKNSRFADMAAAHKLQVICAPTAEFDDSTVTFRNLILDPESAVRLESSYYNKLSGIDLKRDFDTIVLCTGYTNSFDWLHPHESYGSPGDCPRMWYKHCWPPAFIDGSLAFIGWARPHQGGIPQTAELCARFHALLLSGQRTLPSNIKQLTEAEAQSENDFYALSQNLTSLVDWPAYSVSLARMIGCEPYAPWFVFSPKTWFKFWFYPMWPCWYRLRGPGAKPHVFKVVMDRFPVLKSGFFLDANFLIFTIPAIIQKCVINPLSYLLSPFKFKTGYSGIVSLFDRAKINILHGCQLRLQNICTWNV